jgi:hypothetical protein
MKQIVKNIIIKTLIIASILYLFLQQSGEDIQYLYATF